MHYNRVPKVTHGTERFKNKTRTKEAYNYTTFYDACHPHIPLAASYTHKMANGKLSFYSLTHISLRKEYFIGSDSTPWRDFYKVLEQDIPLKIYT